MIDGWLQRMRVAFVVLIRLAVRGRRPPLIFFDFLSRDQQFTLSCRDYLICFFLLTQKNVIKRLDLRRTLVRIEIRHVEFEADRFLSYKHWFRRGRVVE